MDLDVLCKNIENVELEQREIIRLPYPYDWYPHQIKIINWAHEQEYNGPIHGGIIAVDMGLGKTLIAASIAVISRYIGITLIICEKTLFSTIYNDIQKFFPGISIGYILDGEYLCPNISQDKSSFLIITYSVLLQIYKYIGVIHGHASKKWCIPSVIFQQLKFLRVICDESQCFSNPNTDKYRVLSNIDARFKWCLTGTPFKNKARDIYTQLRFCGLSSDIKCTKKSFNDHQLHRHIYSLKLIDAGIKLPEKFIHNISIELSEIEKKAYNLILDNSKRLLSSFKSGMNKFTDVLTMFILLQKVCIDLRLCKIEKKQEDIMHMIQYGYNFEDVLNDIVHTCRQKSIISTKIQYLQQLISDIPPGEKIILFSKWKQVLDLLRPLFGDDWLWIDGSCSDDVRKHSLDLFQHNPCFRGIGMTHIGTVGLNLVEANHVIFMDVHWNSIPFRQGSARVWRIGQTRQCHIYQLFISKSIEEYMIKCSTDKENTEVELLNLDVKAIDQLLNFV